MVTPGETGMPRLISMTASEVRSSRSVVRAERASSSTTDNESPTTNEASPLGGRRQVQLVIRKRRRQDFDQCVQCLAGVAADGFDHQLGPLGDRHEQQLKEALAVDAALVLGHGDGGLELL